LPTPVNPRNLLYSHQIIFTPLFWAFSYPELRLRKINKHRNFQSGQEVKISRLSVKATIVATELVVDGDNRARRLFDLVAKGMPDATSPGLRAATNSAAK